MPILVTNQFPASARVANLFRHGAAIGGTADAELDPGSSGRALKWSSTRPMSSPDAVAINATWKKSVRTLGDGARRGNDPDEY